MIMIDTLIAWAMLFYALWKGEADWSIAAGLFAIASYIGRFKLTFSQDEII